MELAALKHSRVNNERMTVRQDVSADLGQIALPKRWIQHTETYLQLSSPARLSNYAVFRGLLDFSGI